MHQTLTWLCVLVGSLATVNASALIQKRQASRSCGGDRNNAVVRSGNNRYRVRCDTVYSPHQDFRVIPDLTMEQCRQQCSRYPATQCYVAELNKPPETDRGRCVLKRPNTTPRYIGSIHTGARISADEAQDLIRQKVRLVEGTTQLCLESDRTRVVYLARQGADTEQSGKVESDTYFLVGCNKDNNPGDDFDQFATTGLQQCLVECAGMGENCQVGSQFRGVCSVKRSRRNWDQRDPNDSNLRVKARTMVIQAIRMDNNVSGGQSGMVIG